MRIVILKAAQAEFDDATDYHAEHASLRIAEVQQKSRPRAALILIRRTPSSSRSSCSNFP